ncbi:MAG TPA: RNA polymerase sigma-70 factor [Dysgonomonas sp.]|nr:RNA polymerase sigma-70 factor [Dysgonomonas sp.]
MFENKSEEEIISLIEKGNKKAFDFFFLKHYPVLCSYAKQYVEFEDAQEIVQDIMLWIWENRKNLRINQSVSNYLFKSVKHRCLTLISRNTIKQRITNYLHEQMMSSIESQDFYQIKELSRNLQEAIDRLPESYKEAFIMNRFKGKTYNEISVELNVSSKTIDYRIQQALKILRKELKDYMPLLAALSIL